MIPRLTERLARYCARPPFALDRIEVLRDEETWPELSAALDRNRLPARTMAEHRGGS